MACAVMTTWRVCGCGMARMHARVCVSLCVCVCGCDMVYVLQVFVEVVRKGDVTDPPKLTVLRTFLRRYPFLRASARALSLSLSPHTPLSLSLSLSRPTHLQRRHLF